MPLYKDTFEIGKLIIKHMGMIISGYWSFRRRRFMTREAQNELKCLVMSCVLNM